MESEASRYFRCCIAKRKLSAIDGALCSDRLKELRTIMSNKIAMALLIALGTGAASSASAAVSAPWPPPTAVQTAHPVPGYGRCSDIRRVQRKDDCRRDGKPNKAVSW